MGISCVLASGFGELKGSEVLPAIASSGQILDKDCLLEVTGPVG